MDLSKRPDETVIDARYATVTVRNNYGPEPWGRERGELYLAMDGAPDYMGEAWAGVDAGELRDAIDKAVGPREEVKGSDDKPYRPVDRDRLLRHIEDIEATLARRNRRHEEDQEKIREALEQNERLMEQIEELEAKLAAPSAEEQLAALEKVGDGQEVVLDPPRRLDTESSRAKCIPAADVERVTAHVDGAGEQDFRFYMVGGSFVWYGRAQQALELGLTAEDFGPSAEARRKEYEDKGLEPWEIEILMGVSA